MSIPSAYIHFEVAGGFVQDPYCGVVFKDGTIDLDPLFADHVNWKKYNKDDIYAYVASDHPKRWVAHVIVGSEKVLLGGDEALYNELLDSISV